jgi:hypothetical protein
MLEALLLALFLAGLAGSLCRVFTVFAFVVTNRDAGSVVSGRGYREYRLREYSTWLQCQVEDADNYRTQPWPVSIDDDPKINNLARYACSNDIERAHGFINRGGKIFLAHDFAVPWRATKFETASNFGPALKGLFLHIELIQPRRALKGYGSRNDFLAPTPGFSQAQYDSLALVYTVASRRAGFWMIPAFHSVLDEGIRNKHDDPQNFELAQFAQSLDALVGEVRTRTAAADASPDASPDAPKPD